MASINLYLMNRGDSPTCVQLKQKYCLEGQLIGMGFGLGLIRCKRETQRWAIHLATHFSSLKHPRAKKGLSTHIEHNTTVSLGTR